MNSAEIVLKKPDTTNRKPVAIGVEKGKSYMCCTCGKSKIQPFCDGSHEGSGCKPFKYTANADTTEWFCSSNETCDKSCPMMNTIDSNIKTHT